MQYQSERKDSQISCKYMKLLSESINGCNEITHAAIPDRINSLQMERYECFPEQTYSNNF